MNAMWAKDLVDLGRETEVCLGVGANFAVALHLKICMKGGDSVTRAVMARA